MRCKKVVVRRRRRSKEMDDFDFAVVPITNTEPPKKRKHEGEENGRKPKEERNGRNNKDMGAQLRAAFSDNKKGPFKKENRYWDKKGPKEQYNAVKGVFCYPTLFSLQPEEQGAENGAQQDEEGVVIQQQQQPKKRRFMDSKAKTQQWLPEMSEVKQIKLENPEMFTEVEFSSFKLHDRLLSHLKGL